MLGWEFPPFISGGLGVHCQFLSRTLAEMGVQVDFYMPKTKHPIASPHPNLRILQVARPAGFSSAFGPYGSVSTTPLEGGALAEAAYGPGFFEAVAAYNGACFHKVLAENAKTPYSLIHSHDWIPAQAALRLRHALRLPLVSTLHSTEYDRTAGLNPNLWVLDLEAALTRHADAVISVSKMARRLLVERLQAIPERTFVVYNGVEPSRFANANGVFRKNGEKLVLFHGRLSIQKGPDFFLKAAKRVLEKMPNVRFVVSGTGDMLQQLVAEAKQLGILPQVSFTGYAPEDYLPSLYASADVYVLPSVSEPFGITALEAMASGTPAIVSHSTGVKEALHYAMSADFWDADEFANKILGVLSYAPLKNVLRDGSRQEARLFTWKDAAQQTLAVYQFALHNQRPR